MHNIYSIYTRVPTRKSELFLINPTTSPVWVNMKSNVGIHPLLNMTWHSAAQMCMHAPDYISTCETTKLSWFSVNLKNLVNGCNCNHCFIGTVQTSATMQF